MSAATMVLAVLHKHGLPDHVVRVIFELVFAPHAEVREWLQQHVPTRHSQFEMFVAGRSRGQPSTKVVRNTQLWQRKELAELCKALDIKYTEGEALDPKGHRRWRITLTKGSNWTVDRHRLELYLAEKKRKKEEAR